MPTPVTIYSGDIDLNYLPPQWDSSIRDSSWSFYRQGVRWCCFRKFYDDPTNGDTYSPAMFKSTDNGATWTGPIDDAGAPAYWGDPSFPNNTITANALIWNFDIRFGAGLDPDTASVITVLIQEGTVATGPSAGEFVFAYCDFNFSSETWGAPYGRFNRNANVLYHRGYSSQPNLSPPAPVSPTPVFWWSDNTPLPTIEGAVTTHGSFGFGTTNLVVDESLTSTAFAVGDTRDPFTPGLETPPDAIHDVGVPNNIDTSNLRIVGSSLTIASANNGANLTIYSQLTAPYSGIWSGTPLPDNSPSVYGFYPWVIFSEGELHVYWCGPGNADVWRTINRSGSWTTPELCYSIANITLGPNVCVNPEIGGVDVTLMIDLYEMVTFHLDSASAGLGAARYYGM